LAERIALYEKNWEEHDISYGAGSAGEPIPEITKGDARLLGYYKEGLDNHKSDLAIADAENGLSYGSWAFGPSAGYWSHEDSEAAWENFSQRRNELLAAYTRLEQGAEKPDSEMLSTVTANDAERAPHSDDDLASHADRSGQTSEAADWMRFREEAVARHGEKAVADGEELIERLVEAGREVRASEARLGRYRESDEERQGRFEQLIEATASYNQLLRLAAREAVDGNGYVREARWHRDLESAIAMEDLRHEQRGQFYVRNEGRESDTAEQPFRADDTGRPTAPRQEMTRLHQIEQEIQALGRTDRDERDR
jgi:hypothetical protein